MRCWPLLLLLICTSCINSNEFGVDRVLSQPTIDVPLIHGELNLKDLLTDADTAHFKTDEDGLIYMSYSDELISKDVRDLFDIPDLVVTRSFVLPGLVLPPHNKDIRSDSIQSVIEFNLSPEKLNEIALSSGQVNYSVSMTPSASKADYEVHLVLDNYKSRTRNKSLNTVITNSGSIDISDYTLFLNQNKFNLKLVLVFGKSNSGTTIAPGTAVNVKLSFQKFNFNYIKGFFGQQVTSLDPQSAELGIFDRDVFAGADVSFAKPRVSVTLYNQNGVPCTVHFKKLEARKDDEDPIAIILSPPNPVSIQYPTVMGNTKVTDISVANVNQILNYAPSQIFYDADVYINEGITSGENFVMDTSTMKVRLNVDVPLWGNATGILLQDTLGIDLTDAETSEIEKAVLKLKLLNEFPLDGNIQFVLADENYLPIATLLTPDQTNVIKGSTVNEDGELVEPGEYSRNIVLDKSKIENLFMTKNLIIVANLQTSRRDGEAADVKVNVDYGLTVQAGIEASMKLEIDNK